MNDVESHIDFLFSGLEGFVYVPTKTAGTWKSNFFLYPGERQALIDFVVTEGEDRDVYVAPAIFKEKSAKQESVKAVQVVWVEYDGDETIDFGDLPKPSRIVQSSLETHLHVYWKVGAQNAEAIEECNRRLAHFLEADLSGWDINQVLRPPGTVNHKRGLPVVLQSSESGSETHSLSSFDFIPEVSIPTVTYLATALPELDPLLKQLSPKLLRLIEDKHGKQTDRSSYLFKLGCELAEAGVPEIGIVAVLLSVDDRIHKFSGRPNRLELLTRIAAKATHKAGLKELEDEVAFYSLPEIHELVETRKFVLPRLLPENGQLLVTGHSGVGKTQWCMNQAMLLCLHRTVGILSLEMDAPDLKYIVDHQRKALPGHMKDAYRDNIWVAAPDGDQVTRAWMEKTLQERPVDVLIIDSLSELVDPDNKEEVRSLMRWSKKVRRETNTAIMLIHHNRKATGDNKTPNKLSDVYGPQSLVAKSEGVLCLWSTDASPNKIDLIELKVRMGQRERKTVWRDTKTLTFVDTEKKPDADSGTDKAEPDGGSSIKPTIGFGGGFS